MKKLEFNSKKQKEKGDNMEPKKRRTVDNKKASIIIASLILVLCIIGAILAETVDQVAILSQIEGEEKKQLSTNGNTVYVSSAEDLQKIATDVNNKTNDYSGKTVELTQDIDLGSINNWTPIGIFQGDKPFRGTFNGQNHKISNLKINNFNDYKEIGLFGYIENGNIQNVVIDSGSINGTVTENSKYIGSIVGWAKNTNIINCVNKANINITAATGTTVSGGIAGYIQSDYVTDEYKLEKCYNKGTINAAGNVNAGGICGSNSIGKIEKCYNVGNVVSKDDIAGGIAGSAMRRWKYK